MKANNHDETKMKKVEMETLFVSFVDENAELIKWLTKEELAQLKHDYLTEKEQAE